MGWIKQVAGDRMNTDSLRNLCVALPKETEQIQRKNERVFKIGGKMFVCLGLDSSGRYSFKAEIDFWSCLICLAFGQPRSWNEQSGCRLIRQAVSLAMQN